MSKHFRTPDLQDGALHRIFFNAFLDFARRILGVVVNIRQGNIDHPDGAIDQRFAGINTGCALGQFLLNQAELGDGLAECDALLGVADCVLQAAARSAHAGGAELETADVQDVEGDVVPFTGLTKEILHGHPAIVENERACG